jgi:hypothetical protein
MAGDKPAAWHNSRRLIPRCTVTPPTEEPGSGTASSATPEVRFMMPIDAFLIVAMIFFLFLPITDRRTVQMKLCVLCTLVAILAVSVTRTGVSTVRVAGVSVLR